MHLRVYKKRKSALLSVSKFMQTAAPILVTQLQYFVAKVKFVYDKLQFRKIKLRKQSLTFIGQCQWGC